MNKESDKKEAPSNNPRMTRQLSEDEVREIVRDEIHKVYLEYLEEQKKLKGFTI